MYIKVGASGVSALPEFDWHAYGLVVGSEYRRKVVISLGTGPKTPTQISEVIEVHRNHVSATLKELSEAGIVICLTPDLRKGKVFQLTERGRQIFEKL